MSYIYYIYDHARNPTLPTLKEMTWRVAAGIRNLGGGIVDEKSWRRNHVRGTMEEVTMKEESFLWDHRGEISEKKFWRRKHGGGR